MACPGLHFGLHFRVARYQRIGFKTLVLQSIGYDKQLFRFVDGVGAKSDVARRLGCRKAQAGFELLTIGVYQRNQGNRGAADKGSQLRQPVKDLFGLCAEDAQINEFGKPVRFVFWNGRLI